MSEYTYISNPCGCRMNKNGCAGNSSQKLAVFDWLCDLPETYSDTELVEVQFKNTRKGYYVNSAKISLKKGDIVAVEATPGHDVGEVTLLGRLALVQMKKNKIDAEKTEIRRIYRKARENDMERFREAKKKEQDTMIRSRKIAEDLHLQMKIGDVEYQGDGNKAIFYYIADERVDFRQLIRLLADTFKVRIEMRQIGARQEAGRIGGVGPCGRELCCASWLTNFVSVSTSAARHQDISLNPQKLAGQCAKLKCCINYEVDAYVEAGKDFPPRETQLETLDATWYHFKTDVFKRQISYSSSPNIPVNITALSVDSVWEIINLNKQGKKPAGLIEKDDEQQQPAADYQNVVGQDSLTRFDRGKRRKKKRQNRQPYHNQSKNNETRM